MPINYSMHAAVRNTRQLVIPLIIGRVPRLPIDSNFPTCLSTTSPQLKSSNVETWKIKLKQLSNFLFNTPMKEKQKVLLKEILNNDPWQQQNLRIKCWYITYQRQGDAQDENLPRRPNLYYCIYCWQWICRLKGQTRTQP